MNAILVGRILVAHGIRGQVKLQSFTAVPTAIAGYKPLRTADGRTFTINRIKAQGDHFIAGLDGIRDRTTAETLKGLDLFITRDQLAPAAEGEVYLHDLIGAPVMNGTSALGPVIGFADFGGGELMEVAIGKDTAYIPFAPPFLVTAEPNRVVVNLPPDFFDAAKPRSES
jgi:16S rRNA processing protein RimM